MYLCGSDISKPQPIPKTFGNFHIEGSVLFSFFHEPKFVNSNKKVNLIKDLLKGLKPNILIPEMVIIIKTKIIGKTNISTIQPQLLLRKSPYPID